MTPPKDTNPERRANWTTIKRLVIAQVVTSIVALTAFTVSLANLNAKADAIQTSRMQSRYDSCFLDRSIILLAAPGTRGHVFIANGPLYNCAAYARKDVK
jgi:hypothetical protein